ncbi:MAG: nuclear transport factor 2 family protein [Leptolyngbya sp. DLM2.Bin15]|nr:MAG: nuclear transport factor 2 family protein [Leptolyngbya sp. DLM2.Bin15]
MQSLSLSSAVVLSAVVGSGDRLMAAPPETAPDSVLEFITNLDAAANQADVRQVMQHYSPEFRSADGLSYRDMENTLTTLWEQYPGLTYETQLLSWEQDGDAIVTETMTLITGTPLVGDRPFEFTSTLEARQRLVDSEIVEQEILAEETVLMSGSNPPTVQINLPTSVTIGRSFSFDAIVMEPLAGERLMGVAIDEPVDLAGYLDPMDVQLTVLPAGGLFKIGQAPVTPGSRWISAVLVREDGITMVTRRLHIVRPGEAPRGS